MQPTVSLLLQFHCAGHPDKIWLLATNDRDVKNGALHAAVKYCNLRGK